MMISIYYSPISTITWSKPPNITTNAAVEQQDGSKLLVTTVGSNEEGDYTCEAAGIADSYTATLTIRGKNENYLHVHYVYTQVLRFEE